MKKIFSTIAIIGLFLPALFSQTINNIPIKDLDSEFITVKNFESNSFPIRVLGEVVVEYGNGMYTTTYARKKKNEAELRDAKGDIIALESTAQALSLLAANGYELIDFRITPYDAGSVVNYYLFGKKVIGSE